MSKVLIVENPRKKRRRSRRRSSRRKNPALATLAANNPRRRRRRRNPGYHVTHRVTRRSNPLGGGLMAGIDLESAAWVAGGMVGVRVVPGLVAKVWKGMPTTGFGLYLVKFGTVVALGAVTRMFTRSTARQNQIVAGALALVLFDMFNEFLAPKLGLYGLRGFVNRNDMGQVGKFVNYRESMNAGAAMPNGNRVPSHVFYN